MNPSIVALSLWAACTAETEPEATNPAPPIEGYALGSVVINPEGRTTYLQVLSELDVDDPITNAAAVEASGNSVLLGRGPDVFVGLSDAPEWVRYTVSPDGSIAETGRLSLAGEGLQRIDFGNAIIDDELAISVSGLAYTAVVWNTTTMTIERTIDLSHLQRDDFGLENFSTVAHEGLVYIPGRWANFLAARVYHGVSVTIVDPRSGTVVGVAEDERCASGGRVVFAPDGYAYVMGDGRNLSAQVIAASGGPPAEPTCLLRIPPGGTDFDPDWHVEIPSLTGGLNAATELEHVVQGNGIGYTWMFHPELLPEGFEIVDFEFWTFPVFELWQIELGETPSARPVADVPFGILGFQGAAVDGKLHVGVGDPQRSVVYEVDADTAMGTPRFEMDGYLYGLFDLGQP